MRRVTSAYTPSNSDPALLMRIFVERHRLLEKLVERFARSMTTGDLHHVLVVGPRGSGKTHLVTLIEHQLRGRAAPGELMRIAWLGEDETVSGLVDLAFAVASALARAYPDEFPADFRDPVRGMASNAAAESVLLSLLKRLGHRKLLVIMENMDRAFDGLGDLGQKKLRAFLQEHGQVAILATAQQLFEGVSSRDEAFFGFFDVQHLRPLSVDGARDLIRRISVEQDRATLAAFLDTSEGRYRVRALHHLAGGNHRLYVMLSEFLTKEALDDLVEAFERLAEDLTPYFQERIRSLPPQQARIVECLCGATGAMTVKEIAEETFIEERTCSKQLGNLKQRGFVRAQKRGKESFYEVTEPLLRLCLEVKNQRGRPLRLVAQFLRAWFRDEALREQGQGRFGARYEEYRQSALGLPEDFSGVVAAQLVDEIAALTLAGAFQEARACLDELYLVDPVIACLLRGEVASQTREYDELIDSMSELMQKSETLPHLRPWLRPWLLALWGEAYGNKGDFEKALADLTALLDLTSAPAELRADALYLRGTTNGRLGETQAAVSDYTALLLTQEVPATLRAKCLVIRGAIFGQRGEIDKEMADYGAVIELLDAPATARAMALERRGEAYRRRGEFERALADYTAVAEMSEAKAVQRASALSLRAITYVQIGALDRALADFNAVIAVPELPVGQRAAVRVLMGATYWHAERYLESEEQFRAATAMVGVETDRRTLALFALPEPMVMTSSRAAVIEALRTAFREGDRGAPDFGGTPHDLLSMVLRRGHLEWGPYAADLVPLYAEHDAAALLGQGLIRTIRILDAGSYSEAHLALWNSAWQQAGAQHEALALLLLGLAAAVEAINTKSDRPLLRLPMELRTLIRPLLPVSLGPIADEP